MLDGTPSPSAPGVQCIDCGAPVPATRLIGRRQVWQRKRCEPCRVDVLRRRCRDRARLKAGSREICAECSRCGVLILSQRPATRKYCEGCFQDRRRERQRGYDRAQYQIDRVGKPHIGDEISCAFCGVKILRTTGLKKYCASCHLKAASRGVSERKRRSQGLRVRGDTVACRGCLRDFVIENVRRLYCDDCRTNFVNARIVARERRKKSDTVYILRNAIRSSVCRVMKGRKKFRKWQTILGYSSDDLKRHLERQFLRGMSWSNYGQWHIDHIVPLALLRLDDDADISAAWALSNLRPLWKEDNQKKHAIRTLLC